MCEGMKSMNSEYVNIYMHKKCRHLELKTGKHALCRITTANPSSSTCPFMSLIPPQQLHQLIDRRVSLLIVVMLRYTLKTGPVVCFKARGVGQY
jgi:hypothetical protein